MARRRNTGLYEDLSPSLVVPDHFSTSVSKFCSRWTSLASLERHHQFFLFTHLHLQQSSTIVIIYDEQVGMMEDQLTFVFPGEVSGGPLKRVVPKRIDSRTFVLETPSKCCCEWATQLIGTQRTSEATSVVWVVCHREVV